MRASLIYTTYFLVLAFITGLAVWYFQHRYSPAKKLQVHVISQKSESSLPKYHFSILCSCKKEAKWYCLDNGIQFILKKELDLKEVDQYCQNSNSSNSSIPDQVVKLLGSNEEVRILLKNSLGSQVRSFFKITSESDQDDVTIYTDPLSADFLLPQLASSKWVDIYFDGISYIDSLGEK